MITVGTYRPAAVAAMVALGAALLGACSQDTPAPAIRFLDRPSDIAFGCTAELPRDGGVADIVAVPSSGCAPFTPDAGADGVDATEGPRDNVSTWGFVIEGARGDVALARLDGFGELRDSDPLTPGVNGLPVGRLPVEIASLPDGCYVVTANQGSCDLGVVDVFAAIAVEQGVVARELVTSGGQPIAAAPSAIVAAPPLAYEERTTCASPEGLLYVAYPSCQAVAVVDAATTEIVATVRFAADGTATVGDADLACPVECDDVPSPRSAPAALGPEPQTLALEPDGSRLYVGGFTSDALTIVTLDAAGLPTATEAIPLDAPGGLKRLAATGPIEMGNGATVGEFSFVYAIGRDHSIRVIDVTPVRPAAECDTQVDPRALQDLTDVSALACLPPGAFPRRAEAIGPGIRLPFDAVPRDVTFLHGSITLGPADQPDPSLLAGVFALVSAENPLSDQPRGAAYYVNVDDDNYEDFEDAENPSLVDLPLALPHQLRDDTPFRRALAAGCGEVAVQRSQGPLRFSRAPLPTFLPLGYEISTTGVLGDRFLPLPRREECVDEDTARPTFQLSTSAPVELRERLIPDLAAVVNETFELAWEGTFNQDSDLSIRQGGRVTVLDAGRMRLEDLAGEFCDVGVEPGDFVRLVGCTSDFDCGFGELCYVHPDAPEGSSGMCLLPGSETELADLCRDVLVASRRYTVVDNVDGPLHRDELTLVPRPLVLNATPAGGCASAAECRQIEELELTHLESVQVQPVVLPRHPWACETNAAFGAERRCVMSCEDDPSVCSAGSVCDAGRCVLGAIPAPECVAALQRYEPRLGDAFSFVGSVSGYRHRRILDIDGERCVDDPTASPLLVGRFKKVEPACPVDDDLATIEPNPCSFTAADEPVIELLDRGGGVEIENPTVRETRAIRFRLPGVTFEIADVLIPLPGLAPLFYSPVPAGYLVTLELGGGFVGRNLLLEAALPERMRPAPDGAVWVVDSGDQGTVSIRRGQLLKITEQGQDPNVRLF